MEVMAAMVEMVNRLKVGMVMVETEVMVKIAVAATGMAMEEMVGPLIYRVYSTESTHTKSG
jgi:hypothetical protein